MKGKYVNMAVTGIGTYASYTNSYGNTQNAGNKTGRTYKNAHEYKINTKIRMFTKQGLFRKYKQFSLSKAMGDEKDKTMVGVQFIMYFSKTIEQSRAWQQEEQRY
ncbi:hypothetical protein [Roseburia intestinalis]